jgi:Amt family ammonium transporter
MYDLLNLFITLIQESYLGEISDSISIEDYSAIAESIKSDLYVDMGMLWMLIAGILVFFMQAGFTLVESGMTRSKNAVNIAMKNLLDITVGSLTYWFVGYSLMYGNSENGYFFGVV